MSILFSRRTPVVPGVALVGGGLTPALLTWPTSPNLMPAHADERSLDDTLRTALNMPWGVRLESLAELTPTAHCDPGSGCFGRRLWWHSLI
jgi:hypothetical protein